ncbi:MAG: alanine racemase [Clostridium sp.]|nr:alanine racemase [Clostridium sp.]
MDKYFAGRPAWAEIDLGRLKENIKNIQKQAKGKRVMCVVKANAYGHGMIPVAKAMRSVGIQDFAVAILNEALELRADDPTSSIMILGYTPGDMARPAVEQDMTVTVYSLDEAKAFSTEAVQQNKKVKLAVALDTGMSRIGYRPGQESLMEIVQIAKLPHVILEELFTHFSTADEADKTYSSGQIEKFIKMKQDLEDQEVYFNHYHMANSAAIIDLPQAHFDTVRPGIIQYGYYPSDDVNKEHLKIQPILSLYAGIAMVKDLEAGTPVGYGNTWAGLADSTIGTIPVGYADGYNRLLSNKGKVLFKGKELPIRGRVCMDQFMIELTETPEVKKGDVVTLLGEDGDVSYWADEMARDLDTISYEITCNIGARVPRKYINE